MARLHESYVLRFSVRQRTEHLLIMILFLVLALTGFPQKFFDSEWAQWLTVQLGGIDRARWIHRMSGILFTLVAAEHVIVGVTLAAMKRLDITMVPSKKDFWDAIVMLRYYLGVSEEQAKFDRYDYRQKFEYWGLVLGGVVMITTGFVLYFPIFFTNFLPGELIPAAQVAHSNEGLLAFLVVLIWHIYNAHLNPDVFPMDLSIFSGRISKERMMKEHPLEQARAAVTQRASPTQSVGPHQPEVKQSDSPAGKQPPAL
jgi:formate dehydrogenase subunit gamma